MAVVQPGSALSVASSCAAEIVPDYKDAFPNHLFYSCLGQPLTKAGVPTIHVEGQKGHSHFCLEALNRCSLVGSRINSEASFLEVWEFFPSLYLKQCCLRGNPPCKATCCDIWAGNRSV